jgi:outer membrane protein OmpA-like peptidoglycan-associated protein
MTKIFIITFLLFAATTFSQTKGRLPNKTIKDTIFSKGDIIKIPELIYQHSFPIGKETMDSLIPVANFLKRFPNLKVEIGCHTDSRGDADGNNRLSEFRAKHVLEVLVIHHGIDASRITCKSYGESAPIIADKEILKAKTDKDKAKLYAINRRTELKVLEVK